MHYFQGLTRGVYERENKKAALNNLVKTLFSLLIFVDFFFLIHPPVYAATYYLATAADGGSDSNSGISAGSPWLSPNHAVNCGDTIVANPSISYSASNFGSGKWGTVTCATGDNVAWLKCSTFDGCKISASGNEAIRVSASYWGVQGWETSNTTGACFTASPATNSVTIHHIIFANNIANGCMNNGFNSYPYAGATGPSGVDYLTIIGNLSYDAAGGNSYCFSGISVYEPRNFDTISGTHIYIAQNISWANVDSPSCPGNSDGNGIILDDWNGDQSGFPVAYSGQGVVENNLVMGNGGSGILPFHNSDAPIFIQNNTSYGNFTDPNHQGSYQGEILFNWSSHVTAEYNITHSIVETAGVSSYPLYSFYVGKGDGTDIVDYNWIYSAYGNNTGVNASPGFSFGSHQTLGSNPNFASPSVPGAPSCNGTSNTLDCMATTLANFVPSATGISGYGYQPVTSMYASNTYYPSWLCNVALPNGIISNYCNNTVAPTTTDNVDTSWHKSFTVMLTCSDTSGSGCSHTYYTTDGTTPTTSSSSGSGATTSFTLSSDGTYTIKYFSVDNAENSESVETATNTVKIDVTAPALSSKTTFSGWYTSNQTSTFTYTDSGSGMASGAPVTCTIITEGSAQTCSVTPNVCDAVDNCNTTLVTSNGADIDKTAPASGSIGYTDGYFTSTSVSLTASDGTDAASGINTSTRIVQRKSATLTVDTCGGYGSFGTITPTGSYPNFTDTTVSTGNCYQYRYLVSDNAGTQAIYITSNTAKVDTVAPDVTINQAVGQTDPTNNSPINFTVVFTETVSDFATGDVTLTGTAGATTGTVTGSGTTYNVAATGMTGSGTVIASIVVNKAHDVAGNANTISSSTDNSITYSIDDPTLASITISDSAGFTNSGTPTITIVSSGSPTNVAFSCNGGTNYSSWIAYSSTISTFNITNGATDCTSSDGSKTITAKLKDVLDNESGTASDTTFYDISSPTGGSITYTDGDYATASIDLTVNDGLDAGSGVDTSTRIVQRKSATLTVDTCGGYGSFGTITPTGSYPNFTDTTVSTGNCYQYRYLVSDNLGAQSTYTSSNTAKVAVAVTPTPTPTITPGPTPTDTPVPTTAPTESSSGDSGSSSSNSSSSGCSSSVTSGVPDLFQIVTTGTTATLYLAPPPMPYSSFYIAYSRSLDIWEYGVEFNQGFSGGVVSYTINNLMPNTRYYFMARTGSGCATGNWGNSMAATTTTSLKTKKTAYKNVGTAIIQQSKTLIQSFFGQTKTSSTLSPVKRPAAQASQQPLIEQPSTYIAPPTQYNEIPSNNETLYTPNIVREITLAPATEQKKFCILWWCW